MELKAGIYKIVIENIGTYYGESSNIKRRWAQHRKLFYNGRHPNKKLRQAVKILGLGAINFVILEQSEELEKSKQLRLLYEQAYIQADKFNLNHIGSQIESVTQYRLPNKDQYRSKILRLKRYKKYVQIFDGLDLVGLELLEGSKFRLGTFKTNEFCEIVKKIK